MVGKPVRWGEEEDYEVFDGDTTPRERAALVAVLVGMLICAVLFLLWTRQPW